MNIRRVKVYGAGSIGNHLSNAARMLGAEVVVVDVSRDALERMRRDIYPARYGRWDESIQLHTPDTQPRGGFDLICIGTPPPHHLPLIQEALRESPKAIQVEKPLCPPSLHQADETARLADASGTKVFVGYDHVVGKAARKTEELLRAGAVGPIRTLDVEFREHWGGIFKAHPWLSGPADSYLGFWEAGGGASGEHSHAINFWQYLVHFLGFGRVAEVDAMLTYVEDGKARYDSLCLLQLRTEQGFVGRVVQDVVTHPVKKWAFIQGDEGTLEWHNGYNPQGDGVVLKPRAGAAQVFELPKRRPDDFIEELRHIDAALAAGAPASVMRLERGLETMMVIAAAHLSERTKRRVRIDYSRGWTPEALIPA
ncbi:MAG TPA: Gfo/Idh/MocA family oxidoreductase [Opitutaceae bacterium]|nr:Gfo/Idh/MocA family oxidoreductase [Opitutaceae bacterium]